MGRLRKIVLCYWLAILGSFSAYANADLRVITTTQDLAAIAEAVGGEHVSVQSLTPGTRDPHFAVAKPSMIRTVYGADLLLIIGADLEVGWLPPLLQAGRNSRVQPGNSGHLDLSKEVPLLGKPDGPVTRAMGDVHSQGNPHYWLDPNNGLLMARAIAERLTTLDPAHRQDYQDRLRDFEQRVHEKLPLWQTALAWLQGKPVIAYHKSFIYLAHAFGFHIAAEVEPKPGIAPSAAYLGQLVEHIRSDQINLLIMEPYYERRSAQYLSDQTGIHAAVLPHSVGARPGINNYFDLFDSIVAELRKAGRQ